MSVTANSETSLSHPFLENIQLKLGTSVNKDTLQHEHMSKSLNIAATTINGIHMRCEGYGLAGCQAVSQQTGTNISEEPALKMEAAGSSKMSVPIYQSTWRHIPQGP
jgi:hypothetical protein